MAVIGQDLDHAAVGDPASLALGDHPLQLGLERDEAADATIHVRKVRARDLVGIRAGSVRVVREAQEVADGLDGKAEVARVADEAQAVEV